MILYECLDCNLFLDTNWCNHCTTDLTHKVIALTKEEAQAIVTELGKTFIDRDNPLCNEVLSKLSKFVDT